MVDYGLAKQHLDKNGVPHDARKNTDFRGTITYASLNAHNKVDLSRRDDMWSFYFVILDFFNEELPWRTCRSCLTQQPPLRMKSAILKQKPSKTLKPDSGELPPVTSPASSISSITSSHSSTLTVQTTTT